jgi:tRNA uridine 5-carbamoylmethylation protein Kti12
MENHTSRKNTLFLVRGLPGVGKTTLVNKLTGFDIGHASDMASISADDYFWQSNSYNFNPAHLPHAHAWCQQQTKEALMKGMDVAVHNTFSMIWEMKPYFLMVEELNCSKVVIDLFSGGLTDEELFVRNTHNVPLSTIRKMRARWERF